jgi:hypothetical protein
MRTADGGQDAKGEVVYKGQNANGDVVYEEL